MHEPTQHAEARPFGLPAALAVSVLVHLLLLVLSGFFPPVRPATAADLVPTEDSVLRFTFAPPTEAPQEGRVAGTVPFEAPAPPRPALPPPRPAPSESAVPEAQPPADASPPRPRESPADAERPPAAPPVEPPIAAPEGTSGNEDATREAAGVPSTDGQQGRRRFDLTRALQDFGQALDQARESSRRSSGPRGTSNNVFVPDLSSFPTTGYGMGNLVFETRDFDWSDYARQIYIAIWRAWHNRLYQTTDEFEKWAHANGWFLEHQSQIRFVIERSGQVTGILVEGASGCGPLDDSATQALAEVILPPLPADFPKQREVVHARFIAIGEIRHMRPVLTRLKQLGYF